MKLLIITDGIMPFVIGGMQKHSYYLTKNLALLGHQICLVHCVGANQSIPDEDQLRTAFGDDALKNIESICLKFPVPSWYPGHYLNESYLYSRSVYEKLKDRLNEFDFIYAKGFSAWYFIEKKKKGESMPPIGVKFHGYEMFQPAANFKMKLQNWLLSGPTKWNNQNADYIFSYGGKITQIILDLGISGTRVIEIPTGIELDWCRDKVKERKDDKLRFAFIGRFERRKGVEELNEALKQLVSKFQFEFHFIGPIPPSAKIKSDQIIYHGTLSEKIEIQKILDDSQVLVVPSHSEGMPNVIMEGMSRGLAILATDVGAVKSVVDEDNGWFVQPGNVNELKDALQVILSSESTVIRKKQENSLKKIRDFAWNNIAATTAKRIAEIAR